MTHTIKQYLRLTLATLGLATLLVTLPLSNTTNAALCANQSAIQCAQGGADTTGTSKQTVPGLVKKIVNILLYLIGAIAVLMIVIGGIRYVTSNGDSGGVTGAKNTILYAVVGLIVASLAYAIVNFVLTNKINRPSGRIHMKSLLQRTLLGLLIAPFIAMSASLIMPIGASAKTVDPCTTNTISGGIDGGAKCAQGDNTQSDLFGKTGLFKKIVNIMLFIIGAIAVIMIIIGGIRYVVSGGDSSAVTGAKNTILYSVVGIIVAVLAYAIVNFVITNVK